MFLLSCWHQSTQICHLEILYPLLGKHCCPCPKIEVLLLLSLGKYQNNWLHHSNLPMTTESSITSTDANALSVCAISIHNVEYIEAWQVLLNLLHGKLQQMVKITWNPPIASWPKILCLPSICFLPRLLPWPYGAPELWYLDIIYLNAICLGVGYTARLAAIGICCNTVCVIDNWTELILRSTLVNWGFQNLCLLHDLGHCHASFF